VIGRLIENANRLGLSVEMGFDASIRTGLFSPDARAARLGLGSLSDLEQPRNRFGNPHGASERSIDGQENP
jgi:hypothetical protein